MITSPYNFVPLSKQVVMPFWAKYVSHDVPFKNGVSGVLKLKIKAESPIYVRNGVFYKDEQAKNQADYEDKQEKNKAEINSFNHFDNQYFIPSTSIEGMLRSVVEIMSFGRMANKVNDDRYSVRDFQNKIIYPKETFAKNILCGWLYKQNGEYFLIDCGEPARVSHEVIQTQFKNKMADFFKNRDNLGDKSAKYKYDHFTFNKDSTFSTFIDKSKRTQCLFDEKGKTGTIVMTGQPSERNGLSGKHLEFVFFSSTKSPEIVDNQVIDNLFFAYYDRDINQQKADWKWRKPQLEQGTKIPVFFRRETNGIKDMGLSYLYKILYKQSIVESIKTSQKNANSQDFAETIFGYVEGNDALKGRVQIGHAFLQNNISSMPLQKEVLSGPKASYYPNYIVQSTKKGVISSAYSTFMGASEIRGWKRYPIRTNGVVHNAPQTKEGATENNKIVTEFMPLSAGAEFTFDLRYHNLREEELGALLSAITFHNTNGLFHSLGMGKPLGYGKITLSVEDLAVDKIKYYLKIYETYMNYTLNPVANEWYKSPQITQLLTMAKGHAVADNQLKYMDLDSFVVAKGRTQQDEKHALEPFSDIVGIKNVVTPKSLMDKQPNYSAYQAEVKRFEQLQDNELLKKEVLQQYEKAFKQQFEQKKKALLDALSAKQQAKKKEEEVRLAAEQQVEKDKAAAIAAAEKAQKQQNLAETVAQVDLVFNRLEYEDIAKVLKTHFEKYKVPELTETQKAQLAKQLVDSYNFIKNTKKPQKEKWLKNGNKFGEHPWTDIRSIKWLGEKGAAELYQLLFK